MKPRGARGSRHEHHDSPYKSVEHARQLGKVDAVGLTLDLADFSALPSCGDYHLG
jgi:hypothetical protein